MYKIEFRIGTIIMLLTSIVGYAGVANAGSIDGEMTSKQQSMKQSSKLAAIAGRPYHHLRVAQTKKVQSGGSYVKMIVKYTGSSLRPYHHLKKVSRIEQTEMAAMETSNSITSRKPNYRGKYKHFSH